MSTGFTHEEKELIVDVTQFTLDIIGIVEPTPFADGTNAIISLGRGDLWGGILSGVSILPYLGDVAKLGKIPKYTASINRAIELAKQNAQFAEKMRPALERLRALLDDVPIDALPAGLASVRTKLDDFLRSTPKLSGPVMKALDRLPGELKEGFLKAMKQPPNKNPRLLKKHPGPINEDKFLEELAKKDFIQVKKGVHSMTGAAENSDIFVRRIVMPDGKQYFEAIRVDRRALPSQQNFQANARTLGQNQMMDKKFRRQHNTIGQTSTKAPPGQGGVQTMTTAERNLMLDQMQHGGRKGAYSHWHHERFLATPENLAKYMTGPLRDTIRMDNVGQIVP